MPAVPWLLPTASVLPVLDWVELFEHPTLKLIIIETAKITNKNFLMFTFLPLFRMMETR
jgi:hypothetical protein